MRQKNFVEIYAKPPVFFFLNHPFFNVFSFEMCEFSVNSVESNRKPFLPSKNPVGYTKK